MKSKPWSGRFTEDTNQFVEDFTASISFDKRLYRQDIIGSIAHAIMLGEQGIITKNEAKKIIKGLQDILKDIESDNFEFLTELEDIHMNIEKRLIERIGDAGRKLHTARSRNDQVALDIRFYLRDEIQAVYDYSERLQDSLVSLAKTNIDVVMPGYTHLQRAQPVLFSHHMLAYYEMLERDKGRLEDCLKRLNVSPLGAGALAGTTFPIDREAVARELGFDGVTKNSIDSVSDRDFSIEFLSASSIIMMHLSRFAEELILWSSSEFDFIELPDSFCTGSSIMPQKKNPDVPELVRGKTGRVYADLFSLLTTMKGLPLAYNKDMQEDKEPVFDAVDTVKDCLRAFSMMLPGIRLNKERMLKAAGGGFSTATDMADYLVRKGVPFRDAHEIVGKCVRYCIEKEKELYDLTLKEFQKFSKVFERDIFDYITVEKSVNSRNVIGGTSLKQVKKRIKEIEDGK
jgi:argininosuccinate lyase